jgi:hypothetical protein
MQIIDNSPEPYSVGPVRAILISAAPHCHAFVMPILRASVISQFAMYKYNAARLNIHE